MGRSVAMIVWRKLWIIVQFRLFTKSRSDNETQSIVKIENNVSLLDDNIGSVYKIINTNCKLVVLVVQMIKL